MGAAPKNPEETSVNRIKQRSENYVQEIVKCTSRFSSRKNHRVPTSGSIRAAELKNPPTTNHVARCAPRATAPAERTTGKSRSAHSPRPPDTTSHRAQAKRPSQSTTQRAHPAQTPPSCPVFRGVQCRPWDLCLALVAANPSIKFTRKAPPNLTPTSYPPAAPRQTPRSRGTSDGQTASDANEAPGARSPLSIRT